MQNHRAQQESRHPTATQGLEAEAGRVHQIHVRPCGSFVCVLSSCVLFPSLGDRQRIGGIFFLFFALTGVRSCLSQAIQCGRPSRGPCVWPPARYRTVHRRRCVGPHEGEEERERDCGQVRLASARVGVLPCVFAFTSHGRVSRF